MNPSGVTDHMNLAGAPAFTLSSTDPTLTPNFFLPVVSLIPLYGVSDLFPKAAHPMAAVMVRSPVALSGGGGVSPPILNRSDGHVSVLHCFSTDMSPLRWCSQCTSTSQRRDVYRCADDALRYRCIAADNPCAAAVS